MRCKERKSCLTYNAESFNEYNTILFTGQCLLKKDEIEIEILREVCGYTRKYLESLGLKQFIGKTEQEIAEQIKQEIETRK